MQTAAYTRYSSDEQRSTSTTDQLRNIQQHCTRMGWGQPFHYSDQAISGAKLSRPALDQMLADAEAGRFQILLVDDLTRLARDMAETPRLVKLLKFWGIRLVGVSDGVDTDRAGYKLEVGLRGIMGEAYLDDLADKTHRGLTGLAMQGYSAGGLPYGYTSEHDGQGYKRRIQPDQAETVRLVFDMYARGHTPRAIASHLNDQRIKSPRGGTWAASAINGDRKRGIGMLNNALYIGQQVWNKSKWIRDPMTGKRKRIERPQADWIITEHPELAIIDQSTWNAVKARQASLQTKLDNKPRGGGGAPAKYLLSGLLKCGCCGSNYIIVDRYRYGCARHKDRGEAACDNDAKVPRTRLEDILLDNIRRELLSEDNYKAFEREARRLLTEQAPSDRHARAELKQAKKEIDNIMHAIKAGIITDTTRDALLQAEQKKKTAEAAISQLAHSTPAVMLPKARETYKAMVKKITALTDGTEAREAIRQITGEITLTRQDGALWADFNHGSQLNVVAGAGYVVNLTAPTRIKVADFKADRKNLQEAAGKYIATLPPVRAPGGKR